MIQTIATTRAMLAMNKQNLKPAKPAFPDTTKARLALVLVCPVKVGNMQIKAAPQNVTFEVQIHLNAS